MASRPERVLLYRLGSLGDHVIAMPAYRLVERVFPDAERRLLTNFPIHAKAPPAAAILANTGLVHDYIRYEAGTRSPLQLWQLCYKLRQWKPDVLVYLGSARGERSARRDALFFRVCGLRRQIGVPVTEDMQRNRVVTQDGEQWLEFEADRLARNLAELGEARTDDLASWDLGLLAMEHARAEDVLRSAGQRPVLAVSVGTKVQAKDWGAENWRELLRRLGARFPGHAVLLAGAMEEHAASEAAAAGWREGAGDGAMTINACGLLSPRESAAAFAKAVLFIGHDSGPMHLAALGTRCVAIFAARNIPRVWFPHGTGHRVMYHHVSCEGCGLETCIVERKRCLTSISVGEVESAVVEALTGAAPSTREPTLLSS